MSETPIELLSEPPVVFEKPLHDLALMVKALDPLFQTPGIETRLVFNAEQERYELKVGGFYYNDTVTIFWIGGGWSPMKVEGRAMLDEEISDFAGLVSANYFAWLSARDRDEGTKPDSGWLDLLIEHGHVTRKETKVVTFEPNNGC